MKEESGHYGYDTADWNSIIKGNDYGDFKKIIWCIPPTQWTPSIFVPTYEMYPSCSVGEQSPAILIEFPERDLVCPPAKRT